jgi:hypothetical protein
MPEVPEGGEEGCQCRQGQAVARPAGRGDAPGEGGRSRAGEVRAWRAACNRCGATRRDALAVVSMEKDQEVYQQLLLVVHGVIRQSAHPEGFPAPYVRTHQDGLRASCACCALLRWMRLVLLLLLVLLLRCRGTRHSSGFTASSTPAAPPPLLFCCSTQHQGHRTSGANCLWRRVNKRTIARRRAESIWSSLQIVK